MTLLSLSHRHSSHAQCSICEAWPRPGKRAAKLLIQGIEVRVGGQDYAAKQREAFICRPCALAIADASQPEKQRRSR